MISDEVYFWINEYMETQTCRIYDVTKPHEHSEKVTILCGFFAGFVMGQTLWTLLWAGRWIQSFFFGRLKFLNFKHWLFRIISFYISLYSIIKLSIVSRLNVINWFTLEQRWDLCRVSNNYFSVEQEGPTIDLLRQTLNGHLIGRNGDANWPPRSSVATAIWMK